MAPRDSLPRPPADFASLLATKAPVLLVGGQAVNLWALYYKERTTDLAPFVSRDADVLGDQETLAELGRVIGVKPRLFPMKPPGNEVGVVVSMDSDGGPLLIEVFRSVNGVTNQELLEPSYTIAVGAKPVLVRVPGPIALLKAKIANVASIGQADRNDIGHVMILARIIPAYLADLVAATITGELSERQLIVYLERLVATVVSKSALEVFVLLKLDRAALFSELNGEGLPKVGDFLTKRLPRVLSA
jgi:hypothetical protein